MDVNSLPNDFEFERCNFTRTQPDLSGAQAKGVRLWPGDDRPRVFRHCNLFNCETPPGSTIIDCNTWIVETSIPGPSDELVIDGVVEDVTQYHNRTVHAKWNGTTYDRAGFPQTMPEDYTP